MRIFEIMEILEYPLKQVYAEAIGRFVSRLEPYKDNMILMTLASLVKKEKISLKCAIEESNISASDFDKALSAF